MLIAKSDAVILVVSASLLTVGIYRWQNNVSQAREMSTVVASPSAIRGSSSQRSNESSLTAKPDLATADDTRAAGAGIDTPAGTNFGNTVQSSTQNAAVVSGNSSNQSGTGNATGQPLYGTYEVKSGNSLSQIATDYGTTVDTLRTINEISGSLIIVGQILRYPLPAN